MKDLIKELDKTIYKTQIGEGYLYPKPIRGGYTEYFPTFDEVVIGDEKSPSTFKPEITFTKWNKENSLTIKPSPALATEFASAVTSQVDNKVEYKNNKVGWYANPDPDNADNFKFGIILYEKPVMNVFQFQLEGWEEFNFFYQPPLSIDNPTGKERTLVQGVLTEIEKRPPDVVGSYAVYHKTKVNHIIGQTNYQTGKFCHIYRPKFIDANGNWVWGDLHIENGIYKMTIPQSFLDSAVYPIRANDTFGYTTVGASYDWHRGQNNGGGLACYVAKANSTPSSNGTLDSLTLRCWLKDGSPVFNPAIYSDTAGVADSRLAFSTSGGTAMSASEVWTTTNLSYASLVSGTQYWLGHYNNVSAYNEYFWRYDTGAAGDQLRKTGSYPDPWSTTASYSHKVSIYATYTPSILINLSSNNLTSSIIKNRTRGNHIPTIASPTLKYI